MSRVRKSPKAPMVVAITRWSGLSRACAACSACAAADFSGSVAMQRGGNADHRPPPPWRDSRASRPRRAEPQPSKSAHEEQCARGRDQDADTVSRDIGRHAGGLLAFGQAFDAEGVDDDVLGRRRGRDQERAPNTMYQGALRRIAEGEQHDRGDQQRSATTPASRGGGRAGARRTARRAHRPPAPRGI